MIRVFVAFGYTNILKKLVEVGQIWYIQHASVGCLLPFQLTFI